MVKRTKEPKQTDIEDDDDESTEGHNITGKFSKARLKTFVSRINNLETQKNEITSDIRGVYQEAEAAGLDAKVIRMVVRDQKKDREIVTAQEETKRIYKEALGDFSSTPLGLRAEGDGQ